MLLTNLVPALRRAAVSTSPVVGSGGGRKLARDAAVFVQLLKRDGVMFVALITGFSVFGYTRYSVRNFRLP